jgi:hypothetical protein
MSTSNNLPQNVSNVISFIEAGSIAAVGFAGIWNWRKEFFVI